MWCWTETQIEKIALAQFISKYQKQVQTMIFLKTKFPQPCLLRLGFPPNFSSVQDSNSKNLQVSMHFIITSVQIGVHIRTM